MKINDMGGRREAGGAKEPSTFHLKPSTKRSAFTLIEMIGVMALIAILAAVVVPPLFRTLEDGQSVNEDANLEAIAQALVRGIQAYGRFPNPNVVPDDPNNGWFTLAKNFYPKGINQLRYVYPKINNSAETERRVYLEPILVQNLTAVGSFSTLSTGFSATADLDMDGFPDFSQNLRMYLVSSSKRDLFLYCGKNKPNPAPQDAPTYGAALLSDLQGWVKEFEEPGSPNFGNLMVPQSIARWGTASGTQYRRGEYLHVKVVDLSPLFCKVNLREFPYPQSATTQTANPGAGYTTGNTYSGNIGAFSFSFVAPTATFNNPGPPVTGTRASSIALNGTRSQITRNDATSTTMTGTIPAPTGLGGVAANFDITINNPPWWDISPPTTVSGQQMLNVGNTQSFYVIKGSSLSLYQDGAALPASPVLTVEINADSTFEYFNGSWTRVD
jgi:prepilin-type N-terminal cleavage/methylation domain-containing protein